MVELANMRDNFTKMVRHYMRRAYHAEEKSSVERQLESSGAVATGPDHSSPSIWRSAAADTGGRHQPDADEDGSIMLLDAGKTSLEAWPTWGCPGLGRARED